MNTKNELNGPFDWCNFPEGRARFVGGVRGADQLGHEVFAIEIEENILYGEIRKIWIDHYNFDLEIVALGHRSKENIGIELRKGNPLVKCLTEKQLRKAVKIVHSLIEFFSGEDEKPTVLFGGLKGKFSNETKFRNGWVLLEDEDGGE